LSDDVVQLTVASSESEAAMICGYLESRGIHATYDKGGVFQPFYYGGGGTGEAYLGRQEILVRAEDLERARAALERLPQD
jgi:hypothetical protein